MSTAVELVAGATEVTSLVPINCLLVVILVAHPGGLSVAGWQQLEVKPCQRDIAAKERLARASTDTPSAGLFAYHLTLKLYVTLAFKATHSLHRSRV